MDVPDVLEPTEASYYEYGITRVYLSPPGHPKSVPGYVTFLKSLLGEGVRLAATDVLNADHLKAYLDKYEKRIGKRRIRPGFHSTATSEDGRGRRTLSGVHRGWEYNIVQLPIPGSPQKVWRLTRYNQSNRDYAKHIVRDFLAEYEAKQFMMKVSPTRVWASWDPKLWLYETLRFGLILFNIELYDKEEEIEDWMKEEMTKGGDMWYVTHGALERIVLDTRKDFFEKYGSL